MPKLLLSDLYDKMTNNQRNPFLVKETHLEFYDQCLNSFENLIQLPVYKRDVVDKPPIYLPLALQSILEQAPRIKALSLFARYMDTCPSAIYNTLAAGLNQGFYRFL